MRITKVYTRTGDRGSTRLATGDEVSKTHPRIIAGGDVDELNCALGVVCALLPNDHDLAAISQQLRQIQNDLFDVGADITLGVDRVEAAQITQLERWIDTLNDELAPLTEFVLPSGGPAGSHLHLARAVARRAERSLVELQQPGGLRYLNRLSDLLFVMARWVAQQQGQPETLWRNRHAVK